MHKAKLFAADHGSYVFRWRTKHDKWRNKPILPEEQCQVLENDPCFWQLFVPGADVFLTQNLNTDLGLANGTPVQLHSMTFSSQHQVDLVTDLMAQQPPGSVITLDTSPLSVNMAVSPRPETTLKRRAQNRLFHSISIVDDQIVIPVAQCLSKEHFYSLRQPHSGVGQVSIRELFPCEFAFAMTVHKSQGRTVDKVVLALSHHDNHSIQMKHASICVAMSSDSRRRTNRCVRPTRRSDRATKSSTARMRSSRRRRRSCRRRIRSSER